MPRKMRNSCLISALFFATHGVTLPHSVTDFEQKCASISKQLEIKDAQVKFSEFISANTNLSLPDNDPSCMQTSQFVTTDICRVALSVSTSSRSNTEVEVWLPDPKVWETKRRFAGTGNGGLGGCVWYPDMAYAAGMGFAVAGSDGGHKGGGGDPLLNNPDVVQDFVYRSVHVSTNIGKQIVEKFYGSPQQKSYFYSCSSGGRQGFKAAQDFPDDFDGIVAGAPGLAWNNFTAWSGYAYTTTMNETSPTFVPHDMWTVIHQDVLDQCDQLDGFKDGILENPSRCNYSSKGLICGSSSRNSSCLTAAQSGTVDKMVSPLLDSNGDLIFPGMQPGAEILAGEFLYGRPVVHYVIDWFRYAVLNDPNWDPATLTAGDYGYAYRANPSDSETWKGDLSAAKAKGVKILHWHGLMDPLITSENSNRYYRHVMETMKATPEELDSFYRYFRISGSGHCEMGGDGAWNIGQSLPGTSQYPEDNLLMKMVKWVEEGVAPETITGRKFEDDDPKKNVTHERKHCRYPKQNVYHGPGNTMLGEGWTCEAEPQVQRR